MKIKNNNNNVEIDDVNENQCTEDLNKLEHNEKDELPPCV